MFCCGPKYLGVLTRTEHRAYLKNIYMLSESQEAQAQDKEPLLQQFEL